MTKDIKSLSYEAAYQELEGVVTRLESGEQSLEESVELYERGQQLAAHCQRRLETAQLRIRQVDELESRE